MKKKCHTQGTRVKNPEPHIDNQDWGSFGRSYHFWGNWKITGKTEAEVIKIMRRSVKPTSFRLWRKRVNQKSIKHRKKFEYSRKLITSKIKKHDYL